jgi:hypothetical protein
MFSGQNNVSNLDAFLAYITCQSFITYQIEFSNLRESLSGLSANNKNIQITDGKRGTRGSSHLW